MMTGPEHYLAAEQALCCATECEREYGGAEERYHLARAQVHALLAVAAATALTATVTANRSCAAWTTPWAAIANPTTDTDQGRKPA